MSPGFHVHIFPVWAAELSLPVVTVPVPLNVAAVEERHHYPVL